MTTGTIKKVIADRGFGFIVAEDAKEYFFHRGGLEATLDFDRLVGGERVEFEIEQSPKGPRAVTGARRLTRPDEAARPSAGGLVLLTRLGRMAGSDVERTAARDRDRDDEAAHRHYKRRELVTADGGTLVLRTDGTIDLLAADRTVVQILESRRPRVGRSRVPLRDPRPGAHGRTARAPTPAPTNPGPDLHTHGRRDATAARHRCGPGRPGLPADRSGR